MENEEKKEQQIQEVPPKKKKRRLIWKIIGGILIGLVVLIVAALLLRDVLIVNVVRKVGSAATGTKVEMASFSSSIFKGEVELKGFTVANPEGYQDPNAFHVDRIFVKIKPGSLFSDKIVVHEVAITGTRVNYELKLNGRSNLTDIQKNVEAFAGSDQAAEKPETPEPEKKDEAAAASKAVAVELISVKDTEISFSSTLTKTSIPIPLPPLSITDLDTGRSLGETLSNFSNKILAEIVKAVSTAGLSSENIKALGDSLKQGGQGTLDALKEGGQGTLEVLKEGGQGTIQGIQNILKHEKK